MCSRHRNVYHEPTEQGGTKACAHHCYSTRPLPSGGNLPCRLFVAGLVLCVFGIHGRGKIVGITILSDDATITGQIYSRNLLARFQIPRTPISMLTWDAVEQNGQSKKMEQHIAPTLKWGCGAAGGKLHCPVSRQEWNNSKSDFLNK